MARPPRAERVVVVGGGISGLTTAYHLTRDADVQVEVVEASDLGSDSLAAWIGANGWDVTRLTSQRGYRILEVSGR